jgi:hypothetical protein
MPNHAGPDPESSVPVRSFEEIRMKGSVVDPDPDRVGSASFLPDPDWDWHPGHADPDPADPDRYQFQCKHLYFISFYKKISKCRPKYLKHDKSATGNKIKHCIPALL